MWLLFIFLVVLAIGSMVLTIVRTMNITRRGDSVAPTLFIGIVVSVLFVLLSLWVYPSSTVNKTDAASGRGGQTIELEKFEVCPGGVAEEPTFYVRGDNILSPMSVTPQLPANDPDALIKALFGENGYACKDPLVAVAMSMVQPGLLPFTESDDADEISDWVSLFASNGEVWLRYVSDAAARFDGIVWNAEWLPEDGDATFLVGDASSGEDLPALKQREEGLPQPWGAYQFKSYFGDSPLLKELVLIADFGWLALPEGQFDRTPVIELDEPLFPEEELTSPEQDEEQADTGEGTTGTSGGQSQRNQSNANDGGGGNATGGGQNSGDSGGKGGGSGSGCGNSGCGTGGGGDSAGCGNDCPGKGGDDKSGGCKKDCGSSTTTTVKPTTTTTTVKSTTTTTTVKPKTDPTTTTTTILCPPWACG